MIWRAFLLMVLSALSAHAEVARVKGGEHPDFTRIVVEAERVGAWEFGRTEDGYALRLGPEVTGYDLTLAFEKIPKDRVSGLWQQKGSSVLRLALSCACHAIAFEFRPGIVVVDIKSGPAPEGSSFETALAGADAAEPVVQPAEAEAPAVDPAEAAVAEPASVSDADAPEPAYDWLAAALGTDPEPQPLPLPLPDPVRAADLEPLQKALLEQISRGAADGIVEIATHPDLPEPDGQDLTEAAGIRIGQGELPGLTVGSDRQPGPELAADGGSCIPDKDLAIHTWGLTGPAAEQMGPGRAGLLTEFDVPMRAPILRAARLYLSLGFGAEARQFLSLLDPPMDQEVALLQSLGHVVDQEPGGEMAFAGMESCDTAAALWAALALSAQGEDRPSGLHGLNSRAVARSFSALPVHLRRYFGPVLVAMFLAEGDDETARLLRDAVQRAPGEPGPDVDLMEARFHLASGEDHEATEIAGALLETEGVVAPEAAITLVEAAFLGDRVVDSRLAETIAAYRQDAKGTVLEEPLQRAQVLAAAMSGNFDAAFAEGAGGQTLVDLWTMAAEQAGDDLFLAEAIAAAGHPPAAPDATRLAVARRLEAAGFPSQALGWLGEVSPDAPEETRLLAARAAMALRDARAALAHLSGLASDEAETLRARAVLALGDAAAAADALGKIGDEAGRDHAVALSGDPALLSAQGTDPWKAVADLTLAEEPVADGPLSGGQKLVEDSAAARAAIEALLATTPSEAGES